jgi:hypothetical protein
LNDEKLFTLSPEMDEIEITEYATMKQIKAEFSRFKQRNDRFAAGAKLIPDSLFRKYNGSN